MTPILGMAAACLGAWVVVLWASPDHARSVLFGIAGPFAAVSVTWLLVERAARQNLAALNGLLMAGFVVKMVFFACYVLAVVRLAGVDWMAFTVSFAIAFISLYTVEAVLLRRLVARLT